MRCAALLSLVLACSAHDDASREPDITSSEPDLGTTATTATTGAAEPPAFYLPLACGSTVRVGQGNDNPFSHHDDLRYAFDLLIPVDTAVLAAADGVVTHRKNDVRPGDPCHEGGDHSCQPFTNLVVVRHTDDTSTIYKHLNDALVVAGASVARGDLLGRSGTTGWSTTPHVHIMRMGPCAEVECPSIPLAFADVPGDGVPLTGDDVTAMNCRD